VGDFKTGVPQRLEVTADKRLVSGDKPISKKELNDLADQISDLFDEFKRLIQLAIERYPPLPRK